MSQIEQLVQLFKANRNEENAAPMKKYMKDQFLFLGIKKPKRAELMKHFFKESGILKEPFQTDFVVALWEKEEREYQYAALDYLDKSLKKLTKEHLSFIETLLTSKSWWDTVDILASKSVGKIAKEYPEIISETIDSWAYGNHMWLQRTSILFQLKYKNETDETLLYSYIKHHANSKEFFIQKAIGWALREYSKTNPNSVKRFIQENELPKLSIREGSKYI